MFHPQALISCIVPTPVIVGTYLNMENPVFTKLQDYSNEMVMGFATLVENRDDNTGGHIKRTTAYVRMLAEELRTRGLYKKQLTGIILKILSWLHLCMMSGRSPYRMLSCRNRENSPVKNLIL